MNIVPAAWQMLEEIQYSPARQSELARQEELLWQVMGPPFVTSLQVVKPGTVEQSELAAQITKHL